MNTISTDKPFPKHHTAVAYGYNALLGTFMYRLTRFVATANPAVDFVDYDGVQRQGVAWPREKWAEEMGTTPDIFRRAVLEMAEDLGWIVRAQRPFGKGRTNRMHIAVTDLYVERLARCVAVGPKAYIAELRANGLQTIAQRQLRNKQAVAQVTLATVATDTLATVAQATLAIRSPSPLLGERMGKDYLEKTAGIATLARKPSPKNSVLGEERSLRSLPTSPGSAAPLHAPGVLTGYEAAYSLGAITTRSLDLARKLGVPATVADDDADEKQVVGPTDDLRDPTPTVTGDGLARKLRLLGVLEDWKSVCADYGVSVADNITDEQLEGLDWWCTSSETETRYDRMVVLIAGWADWATVADADDWVGMPAPDKPCLEFVRQMADLIRHDAACAA